MSTKGTQAGSYSTATIEATLTPTPVTICSTGSIANVGSYRPKLRVYAADDGILLRAAYRTGDNPFTYLPWTAPVAVGSWAEVDLSGTGGSVTLETVEAGARLSEVRIEGKTTERQSASTWTT